MRMALFLELCNGYRGAMIQMGHGMPSESKSELPGNGLISSLGGSGSPTSFRYLSERAYPNNATLLLQDRITLRNLPQ
jgi:hypothetical protein